MKKIISAVLTASMTVGVFSFVPMTASARSGEGNLIKSESWTDTLGIATCSKAVEKTIGKEMAENDVSCCDYIENGLTMTADAYDTGEVKLTLSLTEDIVMNTTNSYIRFARDNFSYPAYLYDVSVMTSDYSYLFHGTDLDDTYGVGYYYNDFFNKVKTQSQAMEKIKLNGGAVPDILTTGYCYGSGEYKIISDKYNNGSDVCIEAGTELCKIVFRPIRDVKEYVNEGKDSIKPVSFDFFGNGKFTFDCMAIDKCCVADSDNRSLWFRDTTPLNDFDFITTKTYTNGNIKIQLSNDDTSREMTSVIGVNNYDEVYEQQINELLHGGYELSNASGVGITSREFVADSYGNICDAGDKGTYFISPHDYIGVYGILDYHRKDFSKSIDSGWGFYTVYEGYETGTVEPPYFAGNTAFYVTDVEHMALLNFKSTDTGFGDTNLDGHVDLADAIFIMQSLSNPDKFKLTEAGRVFADVCEIGSGVTAADALNIQKYLLQLQDSPVTL